MKKLLCFLGIFILFFLVALPPVLRLVLPDYGEDKKEEIKKEYSVLACSNNDFLVNTRYENDNVNMLVFMKNIVIVDLEEIDGENLVDTDSETNEDNSENSDSKLEDVKQEFNSLFDRLRGSGNVTYNKSEDRETISIDFSLSKQEDLNISSYTKPLNEQKAYYESLDLTCTIKR